MDNSMSDTITTTELCEKSGVPRSTVEGLADRLGIRHVGTKLTLRKTETKLWPKGAAEKLKAAYPLVRRNRAKRKPKAK